MERLIIAVYYVLPGIMCNLSITEREPWIINTTVDDKIINNVCFEGKVNLQNTNHSVKGMSNAPCAHKIKPIFGHNSLKVWVSKLLLYTLSIFFIVGRYCYLNIKIFINSQIENMVQALSTRKQSFSKTIFIYRF